MGAVVAELSRQMVEAEARYYDIEIVWSDEDEVFIARVLEAPGVTTHGKTREEAAAMAEDALLTWLTAYHDAGIVVPLPVHTKRNTPESPTAPEYSPEDIRRIRHRLGMSQHVFASMLNVSRGAVRNWEQGLRKPEGTAMRLLQIVEEHPDMMPTTISHWSRGNKERETIEVAAAYAEMLAEVSDLIAPWVPMTAKQVSDAISQLIRESRGEEEI